MSRLKNKIAVITGGGSGFGEEIAKIFAKEGARVAVMDLNFQTAERVAKEIGAHAIAIQVDVGDFESVMQAKQDVISTLGAPDILVNNAGTTHINMPMLEVDEKTFDQVFRVNVKAIFNFAHALVPSMREKGGGVILNISSVASLRPRPGLTWYNGSKGAVNLLSKSMAVELAPWNIRVNVICPAMSATGILEAAIGAPDTPENRAKFIATIPMGRLAEPSDVANAALYLASDSAVFITGVELPVDGGRTV
ncbi:glucose 1-dehydrogenase [Acinetobacter rongchengensis]|uniref:Glucose 1-dehydrogenase n=1 Tax=Acinetobacter rongchengensis TaxID=2419601 RepID=A0A3A8FB84_9GAMM|nr:glucose 1-dehydrogenase [Acinetobacter rongchengensis]RKG37963.1 glucose 1-dehydrogenase [Acinetobacter rongchengensis]